MIAVMTSKQTSERAPQLAPRATAGLRLAPRDDVIAPIERS